MHRYRHLHTWDAIHRWSSLICTLFLFMLCLTGLPLIFGEEIDELTQPAIHADTHADGMPLATLDRIIDAAMQVYPSMHPLFASHAPHAPTVWYVTLAAAAGQPLKQLAIDARTAAVIGRPAIGHAGVVGVLRALHVNLLAGLKGKLFLGFMGLLFLASLVSGVVLYAPFTRKRAFGAVRSNSGTRSRWLDLHNLIGTATLLWAGVVGVTGVMNTGSDLLLAQWRAGVLSQARVTSTGSPQALVAAQTVLNIAAQHMRGRDLAFVAFPSSSFAGEFLFGVYSRGDTALTSRLVTPVLVDAHTAEVISDQPMPWYLKLLLLSEPLHFGDYGGMPLKVLWAVLDALTIVVLGSGLYLLAARRTRQRDVA